MTEIASQMWPLQIPGYQGAFNRQFAGPEAMAEFVRRVDTLMQQGQVLKTDHASFVSRVRWDGQDVEVKRYNHRGFWHSLRHTIKGSRARRNWRNAHHLVLLKIATPEPLAYVDMHRGPLVWQSYFIARFVPGPQVRQVFHDGTVPEAQKRRIHDLILKLLRVLAEHSISHGDMKHTNILYNGTDVVLTDLDGMRIGGLGRLWRGRCQRDVKRYLRDLRV